ncbi:MAG: divalent-cation tolerance protein CutA [Gammaproteobacteria bacterium]
MPLLTQDGNGLFPNVLAEYNISSLYVEEIVLNMTQEAKHILVICTCPGPILAKQIAQDLVEKKLAACVNTFAGLHSYFRWGGKVDSAEEILLLIKTTPDRYQELEQRIKSLHPYELPEIIAVPISTGLPEYLAWIENSTRDT